MSENVISLLPLNISPWNDDLSTDVHSKSGQCRMAQTIYEISNSFLENSGQKPGDSIDEKLIKDKFIKNSVL